MAKKMIELNDKLDVIEKYNFRKWIKREFQVFKSDEKIRSQVLENVQEITYLEDILSE
jgi:hypothetical protein